MYLILVKSPDQTKFLNFMFKYFQFELISAPWILEHHTIILPYFIDNFILNDPMRSSACFMLVFPRFCVGVWVYIMYVVCVNVCGGYADVVKGDI